MISTIYYLLNESQDDLKDCRLHQSNELSSMEYGNSMGV